MMAIIQIKVVRTSIYTYTKNGQNVCAQPIQSSASFTYRQIEFVLP